MSKNVTEYIEVTTDILSKSVPEYGKEIADILRDTPHSLRDLQGLIGLYMDSTGGLMPPTVDAFQERHRMARLLAGFMRN